MTIRGEKQLLIINMLLLRSVSMQQTAHTNRSLRIDCTKQMQSTLFVYINSTCPPRRYKSVLLVVKSLLNNLNSVSLACQSVWAKLIKTTGSFIFHNDDHVLVSSCFLWYNKCNQQGYHKKKENINALTESLSHTCFCSCIHPPKRPK